MVLSTVITSEEVNYLIYRYLLEAGFIHSAFTFGQESFVSQSEIKPTDVTSGLLISVLQRGLQYSALEHHIDEEGNEKKCSKPYNLLQVHVCDQVEEGINDEDRTNQINLNSISGVVDAPIQSSLSTLNLALQNASIMATNAVYGNAQVINNNNNTTNQNQNTLPVKTNLNPNPNNNNSGTTNSNANSNSSINKKKKKEKEKEHTKGGTSATISSIPNDVEMKDSSNEVVEIKTENSEIMERSENQFSEEEIIELVGHQSEVIGCAWNPQKKNLLASASGDSTVRFWTFPQSASSLYEVNPRTINRNVKVLEHVLIKDNERSSDVTCLEWRRDGSALATGCYDGKARIWGAQGDLQRTLQKHTGPIFAVRWNVNGRMLLTGGIDGLAIIWDVEGGGVRYLLQHHTSACLDADWRNETQFVTSGTDKTVHFYDISLAPTEGTGESFNPSCSLIGHLDEVNTVKFDPSGRWLATCSDDSTIRLWNLNFSESSKIWTGKCLQTLTAHSKEVYTLKWSPLNGSGVFASASFDCSVRLWRISEKEKDLKGDQSSDGDDNEVIVVSTMALNRHTQPVYAIAFSPCGKYLASGSLDETLLIWHVTSGVVLKSYSATGHGGIFDIEWQGNWLAAGNSQGRIIVFEFNEDDNEFNSKEGEGQEQGDDFNDDRGLFKTSSEIENKNIFSSEHEVLTSDLVIEASDTPTTIINNEATAPVKIISITQEQENNNDMIE